MSDKEKAPPQKETDKPDRVPSDSIFEQRTEQKSADFDKPNSGDAPIALEQISEIARDLSEFLKKLES